MLFLTVFITGVEKEDPSTTKKPAMITAFFLVNTLEPKTALTKLVASLLPTSMHDNTRKISETTAIEFTNKSKSTYSYFY